MLNQLITMADVLELENVEEFLPASEDNWHVVAVCAARGRLQRDYCWQKSFEIKFTLKLFGLVARELQGRVK